MQFFLGTHETTWLTELEVPLFISARRLRRYTPTRPATCTWALDSGGFSELQMFGAWQTSPRTYAREARRWRELGGLQWCAPQDWMCEPHMLQKTGLSIREHQRRSIDSFEELNALAPEVPWIPVLQGWTIDDYLHHLDHYYFRGHDLTKHPVVGVGSVCRRQSTAEGQEIVQTLANEGIPVHAFGFKIVGLTKVGHLLTSSDSMAWSLGARRRPALPGCRHPHCNNCARFALRWREDVLRCLPHERRFGRRRTRCSIP